jgi:peptidyl-Lys metalloendopeptidase
MKIFSRWLVTLAVAVAACPVSAALPDGVQVRLSVPQPVMRGDVDVFVTMTVTNTTRAPVAILKWDLPSGADGRVLFKVLRDGEPVAYTGRLSKRPLPQASDYIALAAGASLTETYEFTKAYDFARSGTYVVEYAVPTVTGARVPSDALYLWLQQRTLRAAAGVQKAADPSGFASQVAGKSLTFTSCSASQQTALSTAADEALNYANNAVAYLTTSRFATTRFTQWFGPGTRSSFATIRRNFLAIQDGFANKTVAFDCGCTDSFYAYVFPSQPYKVYLCSAFWTAPMTGTDSKAGTLIHEMSHFTVVAGTDDYAYGQTAARALAISNPAQAIANADSHEYFAENTPSTP